MKIRGLFAILQFLEEGANALLLGPGGVGMAGLAVAPGIKALESGHRLSLVACHDLGARLRRAAGGP